MRKHKATANISSYSKPLIRANTKTTGYDIYMDCEVKAPSSRYNEFFKTLNNASSDQLITLHLQNNGGAVNTYIRMANAMRACKAKIHVVVEGPCYSAGSLLALSGNYLVMQPCSYLMFHNYSVGFDKMKGDELTQYIGNSNRNSIKILEYHCAPFLTKKELALLANDKDVYIHWDDSDLRSRISRHFKDRG